MTDDATVKRRGGGLPVRSIVIEELDGPNAGRTLCPDGERVTIGSAAGNDLVLEHPTVSRYHVALERAVDRIVVHDLGSTNGTRIGPVTVQAAAVRVAPGVVLELGDRKIRVSDGGVVMLDLHGSDALGGLRGRTPVMRRLMATLQRAARQEASVLLMGESGTGKELCARALHDGSERAAGPFVTVDCAAIPPTLFAAELFGSERGAFTGADRRRSGALERARGGTVFLDEVGELPPTLQASLLGALERRTIRRLGGEDEVPIDVRVVSATNRDLRREVNAGSFRLDLFYRLAVIIVELPALREHREDLPLLVEHFLREAGYDAGVESVFPADAMRDLATYSFPGNVRELRNLVASALAMGTPAPLVARSAPPGSAAPSDPIGEVLSLGYKEARSALLQAFERRYLADLIERTQGNVRQAAIHAGMDRSYLTELLARHKLR